PLVVRGVVPGADVRRQEGDQLLVEFQRLSHRVGLDREIALLVDEGGTKRQEERTGRVDIVAGLAETDTEGNAGLMAGLGSFEESIQRPAVRFRWSAGGIQRLHVDACMLL